MSAVDFRQQLARVPAYVPGMPLEEAKRRYNLREVIKIASNECPLGPFPGVLAKIPLWAEDCHRYPDNDCHELLESLSAHLDVSSENLIVANGSSDIIASVCKALLEPGDEVVLVSPTFPYYEIAALIAGASARSVAMGPDYQWDLDAMLSALGARTKMMVVCNPNNPTGTYVPERELRSFIQLVPSNVLLILDEAYFEYAEAEDYGTLLGDAPDATDILVTRTFSKIYGLAGLRVGYGVANREIIKQLKKVQGPFSVNHIGQYAAVESLKYPDLVAERQAKNKEWKDALCRGLAALRRDYVASQANFVMTKLGDDSNKAAQEFLRRGVIIRPATANGWMRISVGTLEENRRFLVALEEIVEAKLI